MKTTKQILQEMNENKKVKESLLKYRDAIKAEKNEIREAYKSAPDKKNFIEINEPRMDDLTTKAAKIDDDIKTHSVINKILLHNYRIALFHEVAPVIIETLKKYNGKAYGEKTREKIRNEINEKTSCYFYINSRSWCDEIHISNNILSYSDDLEINCYFIDENGKSKKFELLPNNKINAPELENLTINYADYIDNPAARAYSLKVNTETDYI